MLDRQLIDNEFSHLKDVIFLNIASVVIPPKSVQEAYFGFTRDYIENYGKNVISNAWNLVEEARENAAKLINAEPSEIAFVKNTTEGIGIVANGLPLKHGDNVILVDQEHPANLYAWINLQNKGVELRVVNSRNNNILIEDIENRIDNNTRVITISAVQFTTGVYSDLKRLGDICKERNIIFVVDGIQAVGKLNIDVKKMNIDYLTCGGNKGLLAVLGAGIAYCSSRIVKEITPVYACYQSVVNHVEPPAMTTDFGSITWHEDSRRLESGNLNFSGIAAINAGVKLINKLGIQNIEEHILSLEDYLVEGLKKLPFEFRTPYDKDKYSGIVCIYYPERIEKGLLEILDKYRIYTTVRGGYIRMSIGLYNTKEQMASVVHAFEEAAGLL